MKVLITGGYGFIGSHVADRFYKEDYEIFIIDNMETGSKKNISFKHKGYELAVEDPKCEEIFKNVQFDVVVHLAAQVSVPKSFENPRKDTASNVVGLVNMLTLSKKYNVKKFIFASSAAVYGMNENLPLHEEELCEPISPYGISKWVGESYCQKWNEIYGFECVCFRFANVYGPRQNNQGEGGVVSIFVNNTLEKKSLQIFGDGGQTRDFIFVKDIADAIYRASNSHISGTYNLSTNTETSVNDLVEILKNIHGEVKVDYLPAKKGDIYQSVLSNDKVKNHLDWSPIYDIAHGLEMTYEWAIAKQAEQETAASTVGQKKKSKEWMQFTKPFQPYIENFLVFTIISWLLLSQQVSFLKPIDISIFYIVIMGIIYGSIQAFLSVGFSVYLLVVQKLAEGREFVSLLYDTSFFFQVALFLFVGLVVGYTVQRKTNKLQEQRQKIEDLEERYEFIDGIHTELREIKDELQLRVLNSEDSFGKIYSIVKELDELEPEKVLTRSVNVVQSIMGSENVSIYVFNKNKSFLRLVANADYSKYSNNNSMKVDESKFVQSILKTGKIFVNKALLPNTPIMAAPIFHNHEISAVITIEGLDFDKISLYHENLFKVTTELAEAALDRALSYIDATEVNRFVQNTQILTEEVFKKIIENKKEAKKKHNMPFVVLEGDYVGSDIQEYSSKLICLLRETDYIGRLNNQRIAVVLSNTKEEDVQLVLSRFKSVGINMKLLEEEMYI